MNLIQNILKENKEMIVNAIFDQELKDKVIKNDNVDVPFISEATEEKIIDALYSSVEDVVKTAIIDKL